MFQLQQKLPSLLLGIQIFREIVRLPLASYCLTD
ncbi:hypothetical protein V6Z11_D01G230000 [Gossypium hirsutum]